ncbi:MAG TPA: hypothetical protein VMF03_18885 [Steroidobacteraceae bacterium]|nr:hypothetical protein [Steroidobacteraceae bacterium]
MGQQQPLSRQYLDHRRTLLLRLRKQLRGSAARARAEQSGLDRESASHVNDVEDDAQRLDQQDQDASLIDHDIARLARIERALAKITEGTYGLSDVSGERIPEERLEVMPEAVTTLEEQQASERRRTLTR